MASSALASPSAALAGGVDLVELGSSLVHVRGAGVALAATHVGVVGHRVGKGILSLQVTASLLLAFHRLCKFKTNIEFKNRQLTLVGQIKLLHASHVHLELTLVAEQVLAIAGCVGVGRATGG